MALHIKNCSDVEDLRVGNDKVECLWVRIGGKACRGDILVGVCYRLLNQDEEMNEAFYEQLRKLHSFSWETSTSLIYVGNIIQCRGSSPRGF